MKKSNTPVDPPGSPLETFRFCPRCGAQSFVQHTSNSLICSACGFEYYVNPAATVVALIRNNLGQYLFTRRRFEPHAQKLDFPGGFVNLHETLEQGLIREIQEELNLQVSWLDYFGSFYTQYPFAGVVYYPVDIAFECKIADWSSLKVADDVADVVFRFPEDVSPAELAFSSNRQLLKHLCAH